MSASTKIVLAVLGLLIGTLVVYYGYMMPDPGVIAMTEDESSTLPGGLSQDERSASTTPAPGGNDFDPGELDLFSSRPEGLLTSALRDKAENEPAPPSAASVTSRDTINPPPVNSLNPPVTVPGSSSPERTTPPPQLETQVQPKLQPQTPPQELPITYTDYFIRDGDTLSEIAASWFGDGTKWPSIVDANPGLNPSRLRVGSRIRLPSRAVTKDKPSPGNDLSEIYVVKSGDNLSRISKAFYGSERFWQRIYIANRLTLDNDPDALRVGMKLIIPPSPYATNSPR